MSTHRATVHWTRRQPDHVYDTYSRDHAWTLGSGQALRASAAAEFKGTPTLTNPEEALVAALSSCHMLTFLAIAARKRFVVDAYEDEAEGHLAKNADGKLAITEVILRPRVVFSGERQPTAEELDHLHHRAHEECFIANSVRADVRIGPPRVEGVSGPPRGLLEPDAD